MIKSVLTDIEGTTSSISFVKDVLFPYARERMHDFVLENKASPEIMALLADVSNEVGCSLDLEEAIDQLVSWIDEDKKITPLKALQGLIWQAGYENGDLVGHMYEDAVDHLRKWKASGTELYIYSSGSVFAQKLLFGHTSYGDLTPLFSGYFDTRMGAKTEAESYQHILAEIGGEAREVMFLSDITAELDAARASGLRTTLLVREGPLPVAADHPLARDFSEVRF